MKLLQISPLACCIGLLGVATTLAGPTVSNISLRGLQAGATTTLVIDGADLLPEPKLLVGLPILSQQVRPGATAKRVEIHVTLGEDVAAGIYQLRLANDKGVSPPIAMAVDRLPQLAMTDKLERLPVALHGVVTGSTIVRTQFMAKAGERVVIDVEARRLGSALNPLVHLYNDRRVQLAWAQGTSALVDDCRLEVEIPASGQYTIELHDALFRGAAPGFFRLKVGNIRYADLVYPIGVQQEKETTLELAASNFLPLAKVNAAPASTGFLPAPWPVEQELASGGRPRLLATDLREIVEPQSSDETAVMTVPAGLNGRLSKPDETDRWRLTVSPGMALRFDVLASRIGSPLDGVLVIKKPDGGQLATSDDRATTSDPGLDFTVPAGVEEIVVELQDLQGRGGERFVYRIGVTNAKQPDFSLTVLEDRVEIPQHGTAVVRLKADRRGYNGPIRLELENLPEGVTTSTPEIAAGMNEAMLSFAASDVPPTQMLARLIGRSVGVTPEIERAAETPETPVNKYQPWLKTELAAAITGRAPLELVWKEPSAETALTLGGSMPAALEVTRGDKAAGPVRLSLVSTQTPPKKKVRNKDVDDIDRTLRLAEAITIPAGESEAEAKVAVPGDLARMPYDVAFKAELLSPNGKQVLATATSVSRRFTPVKPSFEVSLTGPTNIEAKAGAGETGVITGKLVRKGGFSQPVLLTLAGLPEGVPSPKLIVQGNQTEFRFPVAFAFGTAVAEAGGVKLVATSQLDPKTTLKGENEPAVDLNIVPGERPTPEQPHVIFEEESEFATQLTQGMARTSAVGNEKYFGKLSIQVTPEERFNANMPGFGMKIRENPAPGEFRYIQFAWKKIGGQEICLQLAHDGKFGPVAGKPQKFRYHAGPGPEPYGASLAVDIKLPTEWTVVTRDLFADFGEFTLTGIGLSPLDGQFGYYDHIYLGRTPADFDLVAPDAE